ncbi:MAG: RnfABCDGE type electron transport complex subunit G [Treponema sp.]|jgi:electron transport complex protein RnfG|nr:RnfABCDGE type electron transport complex subunit G [Treponema sp.]
MKNLAGMLKLGCILAVYAAVACVMLAFVYAGTSKIIALRAEAAQNAALKEIFPDADGFEPVEGVSSPDPSVTIENAFVAKLNGETAGMALKLSRASYSGPITLMAGVSVDKRITGVKIMEHSDTPGLGANAASPSYFVDKKKEITFYGQFAGKSTDDPFTVKGDVAAVTASTITSKAVSSAVKAAGQAAAAWLSTGDSK